MPPKKANAKRKAEAVPKSPLVKDPFTASKRSKKQDSNEEDPIEIIEEKKLVKVDNLLDDKAEVLEEKTVKSPKAKESPKRKQDEDLEEKENSEEDDSKKKKTTKKTTVSKSKKKKNDDDEEDEEVNEVEEKSSKTDVSTKYDKEEFKKPSNGKDYDFKIVSWNINGIRAWLEKGGLDYLKAEDPDIFCCQETKCDKSKIPPKASLPGYFCYWLSGDTQGYSGVGLMSKIKPIKVTYGINNKSHDNEGRVICAEYEKFYLINTYIPNSGRGLVRLKYRTEWEEEFRKFLSQLESQKPIIWTGDLNVAHNPIDLKNPDTNLKTAGFTVEERACFTKILKDGYFDSFRYLYPNVTGAYTFWSYMRNARQANAGWRLDYFVLSEKLKSHLVDNMIRSKVMGSDHCPISLFLKFD